MNDYGASETWFGRLADAVLAPCRGSEEVKAAVAALESVRRAMRDEP